VELKFTLFKLNLHLLPLAPSAWILVIDIEILRMPDKVLVHFGSTGFDEIVHCTLYNHR
jgi:hypothetical protein